MKSAFRLIAVSLLTIAILASARTAQAVNATWNGTTDSLWATTTDWSASPVPGTGNTATFNNAGNGNTTLDLGGGVTINTLLFDTASAAAYTIGSGAAGSQTLNLDASGAITMNSTVIANEIINALLRLGSANGTQTFTVTNSSTTNGLSLAGGISTNFTGTKTMTVTGAGNTTIGGVVSNGTGTVALTKNGSGTLTLGAGNTYTGTTTILGGSVVSNTVGALGAGSLTFGDGSAATGSLTLNANQTVTSLLAQSNNSATADTITIGSLKTLTLTGSGVANALWVGGLATAGSTTRLNVTGSTGTLTVNDSTRNIVVAQNGSGATAFSPATLDLSGLGAFNATVANIYVARPTTSTGAAAAAGSNDALILANSGTITVSTNIAIGGSNASGNTNGLTNELAPFLPSGANGSFGTAGMIRLGAGNTINANQWVIGDSRTNGLVNFNDGLANPTVTLNGAAGAGSRTNIILANGRNSPATGNAAGGSSGIVGIMDFTGGTVIASIESLTVGNGGSASSNTRAASDGVFTFGGAGSNVNVNTLLIATNGSDTTAAATVNTGTGTLTVNGGAFVVNTAFTICQNVDGSGGAGQQDLAGSFNLNGGTATIGSSATPVNTILGNVTSTSTATNTPTVNINGGTYTSNGDIKQGTVGSGTITSTVTLNGGTLNMTGHKLGDSGVQIGTLNFQAGTLSNVLEINGGGGGLNKTTGGTLDLTGANSFTGPVTINGGTLNFQPSATHDLGGGNLTVSDTTTLGVAAFSSASSAVTTTGTLSLGSSTGTTVNMSLAGNATAAPLNVGTLNTGGTNTINVASTALLTVGQFPLIDYTGSIGGTGFGGLTLGTLPPRTTAVLADDTGNSSVDLNVTFVDSIRWKGNVNANWNINTTSNWVLISNGTTATTYLQPTAPGDTVKFDDTASGNFNVNVATSVSPSSVTINNSTNNYTFSGTGDITTPSLTKTGTGTATISTSGAMAITSIALNGTGAVVINRTDNPTLSSTLSGTGTLRKAGSNTLTLSGSSGGFAGTVDINAGTLKMGSGTALGIGTTNINGGATLDLNGNTLVIGTGNVTLTGAGNIAANNSGVLQIASTVSLANNISGNGGVTVSAPSSTATLSGNNTYTGTTTIIDGTLTTTGDSGLGTGALLVGNAATPTTTVGTLNIGGNETHTSLTVSTDNASANTISIATGKTLTLNTAGSMLQVGPTNSLVDGKVTALTVSGGGTLNLNNTSGTINIGTVNTAQGNAVNVADVDLTGLGAFTANVSAVNLGLGLSNLGASGGFRLQLSNTSNTITANTLSVADSINRNPGTFDGVSNYLILGTGTNVINVDTINVAFGKSNGQIKFASQTAGSPGNLTLGGKTTSKVDVNLSRNTTSGTGAELTSLLDLRGHTVNANVGTLSMCFWNQNNTNSAGGTIAELDFDAGTFNVDTLTMATKSVSSGPNSTSTISIGGGAFNVNTAFSMGSQTGVGSQASTVNLTGGTLTSHADIVDGGGITSAINVAGGTLDLTGHALGTTNAIGTVAINSGGVSNVGSANVTTMNLGTASTNASLGVVLAGSTITAPVQTTNLTIDVPSGTDVLNLATGSVLNVGSTYPVISYAGSIGGTGFSALSLGSQPSRTVGHLDNGTAGLISYVVDALDSIRWNGNVNSTWDINTTSNWKEIISTNSTTYLQPVNPGEPVLFDDNASGTTSVTVSTAVNPGVITFNNSTKAYSISGSGSVTANSLTKNGTNTASFSNSNSGGLSLGAVTLNAGILDINRTDNLTLTTTTLSGAGTLRKSNTNTLTVSGDGSAFTGTMAVNAGSVKLGSSNTFGTGTVNIAASANVDLNGNTLIVGTGGVTLAGTGDITSTNGGTLRATSTTTINRNITGSAGVTGAASGGNVTLSGTYTYSGTTAVVDGTLTKGTADAIPVGDLAFGEATSTTGTLDLGTFNQTATSLTVQSNSTNANTLMIGSGKNLTLTGSGVANVLWVGSLGGSQPATRLNVTGSGGTLAVTDSTRNIVVSQLGSDTSGLSPAMLDLSGLGTFNATVNNIYVARPTTAAGDASTAAVSDTLLLANSNAITASGGIAVGGTSLSIGGMTGTVRLGTTNTINATQWVIGNGRVSGTVNFNDGLTNPSVSLYGATGPTSRTNIFLGDQQNATGVGAGGGSTPTTGTMDFTGGTVTAKIDNLVVGTSAGPNTTNGRGQGNGVFTFEGAGSNVDVNTLLIGLTRDDNSVTNNSGGTNRVSSDSAVNVNGGALVVNTALSIAQDVDTTDTTTGTGGVQDVLGTFNINGGTATIGSTGSPVNTILGSHVTAGNSGIATATLNVNGGTFTSNGDILQGTIGSGGVASIVSTVTVAGGTLDMKGHNLGDSNSITNLNFQSGTLSNVAQINAGSSTLTKTTPSTLTVAGVNTYTGATLIQDGTLRVNGTHTGGGAYTVDSDLSTTFGTLGGTGTIDASVTVNPGGTVAPGASVGTLTVGSATFNTDTVNNSKLLVEYNNSLVQKIDKLVVTGALNIDGATLDFDNLGTGALTGSALVFATYGSLAGTTNTFASVLDLPTGYSINYGYLGNQIALVSNGVPGDYTGDNKVNAADFVTWRKAPTDHGGNPAGYVTWRQNFGNGTSSGVGLSSAAAVPEPASCRLALCAVLGVLMGGLRRQFGRTGR